MRMIRNLLWLSLLAGGAVMAQEPEKILEATVHTMGLDRLKGVGTMKITGGLVRGKSTFPFTIWKKGEKVRYESEMRGNRLIQVWDGRHGWMISPRSGEKREMPARLVEMLRERADLAGSLAQWRNLIPYIHYEGTKELKTLNGKREVYRLKMEIPDVEEREYFIGVKDHLLYREISRQEINGRKITRKVDYGDYRDVEGVKVAFLRRTQIEGAGGGYGGGYGQRPGGGKGGGAGMRGGMGGGRGGAGRPAGGPPNGGGESTRSTLELSKVEFNVPVDDHLFVKF